VKVLLADLETEWRGGQNQALLLLKGLLTRGHAAELVTADVSALGERARSAGICVHSVQRGLLRFPAASRVRKLLRSGSYDIVHANEAHAVTAAWLAMRRGGVGHAKFVISRRVGYPIGRGALAQARYRSAARIAAISKWSADHVVRSGIPADRVTVVNEGVELRAIPDAERRAKARAKLGIDAHEPLLGCVGVLSPDKGQEWLIRALPLVRREFQGAKLILAGDGPCRQRLELLAQELGLRESVSFMGFVADVETIYAALDLFLLPSMFEALSNALMTAMAYSIPSIAFNSGGPAEIIEHDKSGLLVSGPNAEEIAGAIVRVLRDPELVTRLRAGGRARIEQAFSVDKMVDAMLRVYENVLA
jgi:glycosyltransferase involved in cell wall biosynthesis